MKTPREIAEQIAWIFNGYEDYDEDSAEEFIVEVEELIEKYGEQCKQKD